MEECQRLTLWESHSAQAVQLAAVERLEAMGLVVPRGGEHSSRVSSRGAAAMCTAPLFLCRLPMKHPSVPLECLYATTPPVPMSGEEAPSVSQGEGACGWSGAAN